MLKVLKNVKRANVQMGHFALISALIASLVFGPTIPYAVAEPPMPKATKEKSDPPMTAADLKSLRDELLMLRILRVDYEMPWVTESVMGGEDAPELQVVDGPIADADPYFMRTQNWESTASGTCDASRICFSKDRSRLSIALGGSTKVLKLNQPMTPILETRDYIIMTADNISLFQSKNPDEAQPGEGFFFIVKSDLKQFEALNSPVPVFFFPLPGYGWTGSKIKSMELDITDQLVLYDQENIGIQIDRSDISILENVQRSNLQLALTGTLLETDMKSPPAIILPKAYSTIGFGLMMSGLQPKVIGSTAANSKYQKALIAAGQRISQLLVPQADAVEGDKASRLERFKTGAREWFKKWRVPLAMHTSTIALGAALYDPTYVKDLIPDNYSTLLWRVGTMMAGVFVASVWLKYTFFSDYFKKKYPKVVGEGVLSKLNKEHKGIMDVLAHGLYFSLASVPQGIRHVLELMKDRFLPSNKNVHKAWDATMGYQMRQNSRLAMNWKTQYLGWWHGLLDCKEVAITLLIIAPWLANHAGIGETGNAVAAAYASSTVLYNLLAYFQSGAHNYSADVKMVHMVPAEKEAKRKLEAKGVDTSSGLNASMIQEATEEELKAIYKTVGLPGDEEFLFDPISTLEATVKKMGFSLAGLTDAQKAELAKHTFVLSKRRWGLISPTLKRALEMAEDVQSRNPSPKGQRTVELLKWAIEERGVSKAAVGKTWDVLSAEHEQAGFKKMVQDEVQAARTNNDMVESQLYASRATMFERVEALGRKRSVLLAAVRGAAKYILSDGTQRARDINKVIYLNSDTTAVENVGEYMPESWKKKAGSTDVADAGAKLIRQAFFSFIENKPESAKTLNGSGTEYYARAERILLRVGGSDPSLNDPFIRQLRIEQLAHTLKTRTEARNAILNFKPKEIKGLALKQWTIARENAEALLAEGGDASAESDMIWANMATLYNNNVEEKVDQLGWAKAYRYRLIVAQQLAKQVGLDTLTPEESPFVREVIVKAALATDVEIQLPRNRAYMRDLSASDRKFYEAQLFYNHFLSAYIDLSVRAEKESEARALDPNSPEYPGRFQSIRRWAVTAKSGRAVTNVMKAFESVFRNEDSSYKPGVISWLDRNIPVLPDMIHNIIKYSRVLPYLFTIAYLTNYYIWQVQTPYSLWFVGGALLFIHPSLVEFNNRLMKNYNIQVMKNAATKATYSWVHSTLTNMEPLLLQNYSHKIEGAFEKHISGPVSEAFEDCKTMLTPPGLRNRKSP